MPNQEELEEGVPNGTNGEDRREGESREADSTPAHPPVGKVKFLGQAATGNINSASDEIVTEWRRAYPDDARAMACIHKKSKHVLAAARCKTLS